jgi:hypothetical protein
MVTRRQWNLDDNENWNFIRLIATTEARRGDNGCRVTVSEVAMHLLLHGNSSSLLNQSECSKVQYDSSLAKLPFLGHVLPYKFVADSSLRTFGFHFFDFAKIFFFLQSKVVSLAYNPKPGISCLCVYAGWSSNTPRRRVPFSFPFMARTVAVEVC